MIIPFGKAYQAHRVAWALYYGEWPEIVDHINGRPADNRIANLRSVDATGNCRNLARPRRNKSGQSGVCWHRRDGVWIANIRVGNNRKRHLGYFTKFEDAVAARKKAERELGYHRNHGRELS